MRAKKYVLTEQEMPRQWYNIMADMPNGMEPPLHPGTGQPCGPDDLAPIFPMNLIEQEVSTERWIDIPEEILDKYAIWRPSPLYRAYNLEKALDTPAKIYFKNEGVSPAGSHKLRHIIIKWQAPKRLQQKQGPASGEAPFPCAARFSVLSVRYLW